MLSEPALLATLVGATFVAGVIGGGVVWQLAVVRPRMSGIVSYAETLLRRGPDSSARPPRDRQLADVLGRLGARLSAVEALATTDQLTGVLNRQTSLMRLAAELQRAARYDGPISVALADIDHFKRVNDTYGHAAGDVVLRHVAQILRSNLRATDTVGRYGGEEFLLVLPEADVDRAAEVAEKLRRLVGRTPVQLPGGEDLSVTVSIGVASGRGGGLRLDGMTHDADTALYAAKSLGRDQVYLFRELDDERTIRRAPITAAAHDEAVAVGRRAAEAAEDRLSEAIAPPAGSAGRPSELIADLAVRLASAVGLPDGEIRRIRTASLLHDVGKVAIPDEILSKPTELSPTEWRTVMEHPKVGQIVLEQAGAMRDAATIALHHHEWFNGRGYPHGLSGADIPVGARIVAIADAYEAMISSRPYRRSRTPAEALAELRRCAGTQFDPELVKIFVAQFDDGAEEVDGPSRFPLRTGTSG